MATRVNTRGGTPGSGHRGETPGADDREEFPAASAIWGRGESDARAVRRAIPRSTSRVRTMISVKVGLGGGRGSPKVPGGVSLGEGRLGKRDGGPRPLGSSQLGFTFVGLFGGVLRGLFHSTTTHDSPDPRTPHPLVSRRDAA